MITNCRRIWSDIHTRRLGCGLARRYLGSYPLLEDNSERAGAETSSICAQRGRPAHLSLYAELLNVFDFTGEDVAYLYASNVAGFDPSDTPVEGRMSRTIEPRTLRVGVKYTWRGWLRLMQRRDYCRFFEKKLAMVRYASRASGNFAK